MKRLRQVLCIFLAVMMLFFGVNNSYFSPHKMDTVEATSIVVGTGAVITIEMIIQLLCALAVAGLTVGLICEWQDMDLDALLNDVHDWLADNLDVLDSINIDGTSALKEWAQADEWEIVIGGSAPNPSPDPDNNDDDTSTSLPTFSPFTLTNLAELAVGGYYVAQELLDTSIPLDDGYLDLAGKYMEDKIENYPDAENELDDNGQPLDPITDALKYRYGDVLSDADYHFLGDITYNSEGEQVINYLNVQSTYNNYQTMISSTPLVCLFNGSNLTFYKNVDGVATKLSSFRFNSSYLLYTSGDSAGQRLDLNTSSAKYISWSLDTASSINVPIFNSVEAIQNYFDTGDISDCINLSKSKNYIDSDDDYGWASTAALSPADLASLMPEIAPLLNNHEVSLNNLSIAINALKQQLEEQNPNNVPETDTQINPLPYPDVPTYIEIVKQIVNDPEIFPEVEPIPEPNPDIGTETNPDIEPDVDPNPDVGTDASPDYTGLLGTIINILQSILNLLKEFLSWFIIDFAVIKAYLLAALGSIPAFDGFEPVLGYIDDFRGSIGDGYDYPVISIQTPDILLPYYEQPEIILCDFEDYAKYFIWVRAFLSFSISFGFGLWFVNDIKKFFSQL